MRICNLATAALVILAFEANLANAAGPGGVGGAVGQATGRATGAVQGAANAEASKAGGVNASGPINAGGATGFNANAQGNVAAPSVGVHVQPGVPRAAGGAAIQGNAGPAVGVDVRTNGGVETRGNFSRDGRFQDENRARVNVTGDDRPDQWRYRWENNRWWYWTPENRWMSYSDPGGWTYYEPSGAYSAGYGGVTVTPDTQYQYAVPGTTYYYPGSGYYYSYPRRYYNYGGPGVYIGGRGWGVGVGGRGRW